MSFVRLPPKRKRPKMGVRVPVQRVFRVHRRWLKRTFGCVVPGCTCNDPRKLEIAHMRSAANAGMQQTPPDWFAVIMCADHHRLLGTSQHNAGMDTFQRMHNIDLWATAAELARQSPDEEMKAAMVGLEGQK